ncbi:DUF3040 domain-containing protein [Streptomyces sp. NPDC055103]
MDEVRLSARELRALAEIEEQLDQDEPLARRLRTMSRGLRWSVPSAAGVRRRLPVLGVVALGLTTVTLLVLAVGTEAPALIWAFAATWVLTLTSLLNLVVRWSRRRTAGPRTTPTP